MVIFSDGAAFAVTGHRVLAATMQVAKSPHSGAIRRLSLVD
jgi:hypothetical protein